jgi:hypothetical protein
MPMKWIRCDGANRKWPCRIMRDTLSLLSLPISSVCWLLSSVAPELHSISLSPRRSLPRASQPPLRSSFSPRAGRRSSHFPRLRSLPPPVRNAMFLSASCTATLFCPGSPSPRRKLPARRRPSGRSEDSADAKIRLSQPLPPALPKQNPPPAATSRMCSLSHCPA